MTLTGVGTSLPGPPVTNAELADAFALSARWLDVMTGNEARHYCRSLGEDVERPRTGTPDSTRGLAVEAARKALHDAGDSPLDMDFVVLATASPDELMPATVNHVVDDLGINDIPAIQVASGCAGALQALYVAQALLSTGLRHGLVIGGDTCRQLWPSADSAEQMQPQELINLAMFGDGAGAVVVDGRPGAPGLAVEHLLVRTVGEGRAPGQVVRWYGASGAPEVVDSRGRQTRESMASEDYKAIEQEVPKAAVLVMEELLAQTGWSLPEVDLVLPPQLNGVMTERIREVLGVRPDRAVSCVARTGNNGNGLPLIQLAHAVAALRSTRSSSPRRLLVIAIESSKWIHSGMALTEVTR